MRVAVLAAVLLLPAVAEASPWTLRQGELVVSAGFDYQSARNEFLDDYDAQRFPLRGQYRATSFTLGARAGFTDDFELEIQLPLKLVSYRSDPVLFNEGPDLDFFQENIIDLSRSRQGLGDLWLTARYNLARWPIAAALETRLKTPTGYDGPEGTFGDDPQSQEDFLARADELVTPENVSDDVVLGDGQVDIQLNVLLGASLPTRTFFRVDAGYNVRLGGAGDQLLGSFKVGQAIGDRVLVFADARIAYTVTTGRIIGVSVAAIDPSLPAQDYRGTDNLLLREVRLERDACDVAFGGIVRITESVEMNMAFQRTLWGRNTSQVNAIFIGFSVRTMVIDPPAEEAEEDAVEEEPVEDAVLEETREEPMSALENEGEEPLQMSVDEFE